MDLKKDQAFKHVLCMHLKHNQFSYAAVHKDQKKITFSNHLNDIEYNRPSIEKIISEEIFKYDFSDFVLTAGSDRNTLVPSSVFNFSKPGELFRFNFSEPIDNLDYNRIAELDIVNIYEIPLWIKSAFVIKFPRIKIVHRSTVLLKGVFNQPTFYAKIHLYIEEDCFYLFITERSKLIYYNRFDYQSVADIVYHTLFVLEQKEISTEKTDLHLYGISPNWAHLNEFSSFFKNAPKVSSDAEQGSHFLLAKQLLCV